MFSPSLHALSFPMRNDDVRMSNFLSNSKGFFLSIKSFPVCLVLGLFLVSSIFGRRLVCSARIQAPFFRALQCVLVGAISVSVVLVRFFPHFFFRSLLCGFLAKFRFSVTTQSDRVLQRKVRRFWFRMRKKTLLKRT
jgi:hypothetical protein